MTLESLQLQKEHVEKRYKEVKDENIKFQRYIISGAKGSVIAEQVKALKNKVLQLEQERDNYESLFNQA